MDNHGVGYVMNSREHVHDFNNMIIFFFRLQLPRHRLNHKSFSDGERFSFVKLYGFLLTYSLVLYV